MKEFALGVIVSFATGAIVNEASDVSPRLALWIVPRSARLWAAGDKQLTTAYTEEWAALVDDIPGKFSKLVVAVAFLTYGVFRAEKAKAARFLAVTRAWVQQISPAYVAYGGGLLGAIGVMAAGLGALSLITDAWGLKAATSSWQWTVGSVVILLLSAAVSSCAIGIAKRARRELVAARLVSERSAATVRSANGSRSSVSENENRHGGH